MLGSVRKILFLLMVGLMGPAFSVPFTFTYSGRLLDTTTGQPISGTRSIKITFWTAQTAGSQLAANAQTGVTNDTYSVSLTSGVFSQTINLSAANFHTVFPDSTTGTWVQVQDMTAGTTYPRQQFTTVPYALKVPVDGSTITYNSSGQLQVSSFASGSSVGIGTVSPHASAMLDVTSTSKGFLPPRMTTAQRDAISSPATGLMIYNSTTSQIEMYNGSGWIGVGSTIPTGAIAAFASSTCPSGWTEYTASRGRFLRGIDNGAGNDPDGTRAAGSVQTDAVQGHTHGSTSVAAGQYGLIRKTASGEARTTNGSLDSVNAGTEPDLVTAPAAIGSPTTDGTNGTPRTSNETRPENVAVIFCQYSGGNGSNATGANQIIQNSSSVTVTDAATSGTIALVTSGTEVMRVTSNGRVGIGTTNPTSALTVSGNITTPSQSFFEVRLCTANFSAGSTIVWDTVLSNVGSSYSTSTGAFTAPVSGVYTFGFNTLMNYAGSGEYRIGFYKNGVTWNQIIEQKSANTWKTIQGTMTTYLNANDTITIVYVSGSGTTYNDCGYNRFWGRLGG